MSVHPSGVVKGDHRVDELFARQLRFVEALGDAAAVQDDEPVGHVVDVEDVVIDEDRGLALGPDRLGEFEDAVGLLEGEPIVGSSRMMRSASK